MNQGMVLDPGCHATAGLTGDVWAELRYVGRTPSASVSRLHCVARSRTRIIYSAALEHELNKRSKRTVT